MQKGRLALVLIVSCSSDLFVAGSVHSLDSCMEVLDALLYTAAALRRGVFYQSCEAHALRQDGIGGDGYRIVQSFASKHRQVDICLLYRSSYHI